MFNFLTEDGNFNISLETPEGTILQEFNSEDVLIEGTGSVSSDYTYSIDSGPITVTGTGSVGSINVKAVVQSVTISGTGEVFAAGNKAQGGPVSIVGTGNVNAVMGPSFESAVTIEGTGEINTVSQGIVTQSVRITGGGDVIVKIRQLRPDPIQSFAVDRSESSAELSWVSGDNTSKVEIYRSLGDRAIFSKIAETANESYTDNSINSTDTYAYRLVPIGTTNARGLSSFVVYTATQNIL